MYKKQINYSYLPFFKHLIPERREGFEDAKVILINCLKLALIINSA